VLCCAVQCCAVLCCAVLCSAVLCQRRGCTCLVMSVSEVPRAATSSLIRAACHCERHKCVNMGDQESRNCKRIHLQTHAET